MIHETRSLDDAIAFLNELLALDEPAMSALVAARVPCNMDIAVHPSVQVGLQPGTAKEECLWEVGILGLLNGLFGTVEGGDLDGWGPISADAEPYCPNCHIDAATLSKGGWKPGDDHCPMCCLGEGEPVCVRWKIIGFRRTSPR